MKNALFSLFISLVILSCTKSNDNPVVKEMSLVRGYKNWYIDTFRCGLFVPPSYDKNKKYPLIVRLHGYSDTTSHTLDWYKEPIVTDDPCIVLTPKCPIYEVYGWGDSFDSRISPMMAKTYEMIKMIEEAFNLDKDRYYIYGTSMGGYGTYGVLKLNPDMFAAGYVECGNPSIEIAPIIANMPFWIFHGSADPVVPVQPSRNLYKAIIDLGGKQIRYTEYQGIGHNVWDYTSKETTLTTWLLAQRKGSNHNEPEYISRFAGELKEDKKVYLNWVIPTDSTMQEDKRVWYCRLYRNGDIIKEIYNNNNTYVDSLVSAYNDYEYKITAVNYYFKESTPSQSITISVRK